MAFHHRPTSSFQPCETFFVECDDYTLPPLSAKQQAEKEHTKLVARERQYAIADQLSKIASDELREDILSHMLEMDVSGHEILLSSVVANLSLFC